MQHRSLWLVLLGVSLQQLAACSADLAAPGVGGLNQAASLDGKQLALGKAHGCSLDAAISGVICWGDNRRGQTDVPPLAAPTFIAAGGDTSCAIASGQVRCWGDGLHGQRSAPLDLFDAKKLAVGDAHVCALTNSGRVRCWGDDSAGQTKVPDAVRGAEQIAAGARHTCALAGGKIYCWGDDSQKQIEFPPTVAPSALVSAGDHSCVIDSGKVLCWGGSVRALLDEIPAVQEPSVIATGAAHACVVDAKGVQCWGDAVSGDLTPPELTMVTQLGVGGGDGFAHACSRDLQGVKCWGANNFKQTSYDGGALHILHHSEANIHAPAEKVWSVIMDLDSYPDWNPYTVGMKSTLEIGDPMVMQVKMSELLTIEQTEYIRVLEEGHKVCWGIDTDSPEFNSGERCQWLEPLPDGGTRYVTEDLIEGTANPLVTVLFGDAVQNGFDAVAVALKKRCE